MLAHISTSFWSTPHNTAWGLCQLALQSRGNTALLAVCSEDCQADECADTLNGCAERQWHTLLKEETYISSLPLHNREMRGKDVSISEYGLDFFNVGYIFYIDDSRERHSIFRDSYNPVPACSLRATHNLRTNRT